jgi:hypothetical protein
VVYQRLLKKSNDELFFEKVNYNEGGAMSNEKVITLIILFCIFLITNVWGDNKNSNGKEDLQGGQPSSTPYKGTIKNDVLKPSSTPYKGTIKNDVLKPSSAPSRVR